MILTTLLGCSIPLVWELYTDYNEIVIRGKVDKHLRDFIFRAIGIVAIGIIWGTTFIPFSFDWLKVLQTVFLAVAWFWIVFDYVLNYLIGEPILSLGTTSWLDRRLGGWPWWVVMFCKVMLFIAAVMFYTMWDEIQGKGPRFQAQLIII